MIRKTVGTLILVVSESQVIPCVRHSCYYQLFVLGSAPSYSVPDYMRWGPEANNKNGAPPTHIQPQLCW